MCMSHNNGKDVCEICETEREEADEPADGKEGEGPPLCKVCTTEEPDSVLFPCGHQLICQGCARVLLGGNRPVCPLCQQEVTKQVIMFKS